MLVVPWSTKLHQGSVLLSDRKAGGILCINRLREKTECHKPGAVQPPAQDDSRSQPTYEKQHLGFEHHGDSPWGGDGGCAGGDGQTELHVPFQLGSLVWELGERGPSKVREDGQ